MDLTINGRLDAFRTQHLAGPFFYRQLLPALEKIFDELSDEHQSISIDTLQLDLGIIPVRDLEDMTWNNVSARFLVSSLFFLSSRAANTSSTNFLNSVAVGSSLSRKRRTMVAALAPLVSATISSVSLR